MYLFDIANRLREDPAVKEALVCQSAAENGPLVAYIVLEDAISEPAQVIPRRLDSMMKAFLPAGLRIAEYRFERDHLRINIVGKIDRQYYHHRI